jgi:hypothetical protein
MLEQTSGEQKDILVENALKSGIFGENALKGGEEQKFSHKTYESSLILFVNLRYAVKIILRKTLTVL